MRTDSQLIRYLQTQLLLLCQTLLNSFNHPRYALWESRFLHNWCTYIISLYAFCCFSCYFLLLCHITCTSALKWPLLCTLLMAVYVSYVFGMPMSCLKVAEPFQVPFGGWAELYEPCIRWGLDLPWEGVLLRGPCNGQL